MAPVRWTGALLLVVPAAIYVVLWRWRRRRQRRFGFVSGALATVMIIGIFGWSRSYWRVDELWYGPAAERHELISSSGMLQYVSIRGWDERFPLVYGGGVRTGDLDRALSLKQLHDYSLSSRFPLAYSAEGVTPPWPDMGHGKIFEDVQPVELSRYLYDVEDWPLRRARLDPDGGGGGGGGLFGGGVFGNPAQPTRSGTAYQFHVIGIHWCYVVAIGAIGPLSWRLTALRAKRRRFKGRCGECSYDLRATPRDQPCPECGTLRRVKPRPPVEDRI